MKPVWKYTLAASVLTAITVLLVILDVRSSAAHKELTCTGLKVEFAEQDGLDFVTANDIKGYVAKDYGNISGMKLESIDLAKIEKILNCKSAVLKSEAYTTRDGILHILISQREPAVRFISPNGGWYTDSEGFMFPLQKNYTSRVPIVDGAIPVNFTPGYKGKAGTAKERAWIEGILSLIDYMESSRKWEDAIVQIHVDSNGKLVLVPREGKEKFIFGRPEEFEKKFAKIEDYYKYIVPEKGEGYYSYVNVSFDGQIVCRNKN